MFINKMFHDNSIFSLCTDEKWWSLQKSVNCFKSRVYVADNQTFFHRCCSATQLCPTLCSTPGFPVLHFTNPYPGVCSNSYPLSQWCYLTISSSAAPFSFCLRSCPASESSNESSLPMRWPKHWSFSISPSNEYSGSVSLRTDCPCCPRDCQESSPAPQSESTNSYDISYFPTISQHTFLIIY